MARGDWRERSQLLSYTPQTKVLSDRTADTLQLSKSVDTDTSVNEDDVSDIDGFDTIDSDVDNRSSSSNAQYDAENDGAVNFVIPTDFVDTCSRGVDGTGNGPFINMYDIFPGYPVVYNLE